MSRELELKPWLLRSGKISNTDGWVLEAFASVNPRLEKELRDNNVDIKDVCAVTKVYTNPSQTNSFKYNTIAEIETDGCHILNKEGGPLSILFSYGRVDLALLEFSQTETVGVPDVPFIVRENTEAGIKAAYYNLVDSVEFLEDVAGQEGVKKWKVTIRPDNRAAIFTRWEKKVRRYYNEFIVYARQYKETDNFNSSEHLGDQNTGAQAQPAPASPAPQADPAATPSP
nr:MAG TPA: hypothetical protein [Bacteriophage sp.]